MENIFHLQLVFALELCLISSFVRIPRSLRFIPVPSPPITLVSNVILLCSVICMMANTTRVYILVISTHHYNQQGTPESSARGYVGCNLSVGESPQNETVTKKMKSPQLRRGVQALERFVGEEISMKLPCNDAQSNAQRSS